MKLLNTGPGEWSDRLTILSLKILIGTERGKDCTHFQTEQTALLSQIRSRTLNGKWFEQVLELAAVNGMLWHCEDQMRAYRSLYKGGELDYGHEREDALMVAFRIQSLNDRRAELVQQINKDAGEGGQAEKL